MTNYHFKQPKIYASTPKIKETFNKKIIFYIVFVLVIIGLIVWFFVFSPYFKIKKIVINGQLNSDVKTEIDKFYNQNILFFGVKKIESELAARQSSIKSLDIYKGIPDILKVKVNVRNPIITWKTQDKTYYIDESGIIFELNQNTDDLGNLPIIVDTKNAQVDLGKQTLSKEFINFILDTNKYFNTNTGASIKEFRINETTFQVEVVTDQGWRVYFDTTRSISNQLGALKKILAQYKDQIHEYVDLRVEGKAYYK